MKNFWTKITALLCASILAAVLFSACAAPQKDDPNTGNSSTEQTQPDGGDTDSGNSSTEQTPGEEENGAGTSLTRDQYGQIYMNIGDTLLEASILKPMQPSTVARSLRTLALDEDEIYTVENGDSQWIMLATAYIYFTAELYKNDSFVITESPVALSCTYYSEAQADVTELYLSSSVNNETGKIVLNLDFTTDCYTTDIPTAPDEIIKDENLLDTTHTYVYVSANYDFASNTVNSVLIHMWMYNYESLISTKFSDGAFLGINANYTEQVTEHVLQLKEAFTDTFGNKVQLGDFSEEVTRANDYMFDKIAGN